VPAVSLEPARVLVADPPWRFSDKLPGKGRGAAKFYATMSAPEIGRFPLPSLADDAVLFLWRVAAMPQEALDVVRAWGFEPKTELVWDKVTRKKALPHFGMGRIVRASHETCLIATRGRPLVKSHSVRSRFDAPVGGHSEKPERFFELVEQLYDGPYHELFARSRREGWRQEGLELPTAEAAE
jgi:N6-adenosine-specific RNA methylase IME4